MWRRLMFLLLAILATGCVRRWEDKVVEVGEFLMIDHWVEENFVEKRSGIDYREICNKKSGDCYMQKGWSGSRSPRNAWIYFSKNDGYASLYYDNIRGEYIENPIFSLYDVYSGDEIGCSIGKGDGYLKGVSGVAYSWEGLYGIGRFKFRDSGMDKDLIFFLSIRGVGCDIGIIKSYEGGWILVGEALIPHLWRRLGGCVIRLVMLLS